MRATREGRRFYIACFLIAVAAVNTGNNLIYLILSLLLSFIVLSVIILKLNLSRLSLAVSAAGPFFANEEGILGITTANHKKSLPSYSINIFEVSSGASVYCPLIPPLSQAALDMRITFRKRGVYSFGSYFFRSGFPFILLDDQTAADTSGEVVVYPAFIDLGEIISEVSGREDGRFISTVGPGEDIYSIRDFRGGDDWRKIHWKASAKASFLMVKEYAEFELRKTTIIVDNLMPVAGSEDERGHAEIFERAVSASASLARHFLGLGHYVRLYSCSKVVPFGNGDEQLFRILDILAVMQQEPVWETSVPSDGDGFNVAVSQGANTEFMSRAGAGDLVIYADRI